jgi:hypothetical protein
MANRALLLEKWTTLACTGLSTLAAVSGFAALCAGCSQKAPVDEPQGTLQPYHPLVPGSTWQYAHSDWNEVVTLAAADPVGGAEAFLISDSPNPSDDLRSDAIITNIAGRVVRLTKDEYLVGSGGSATLTSSVTYGVGFTRFNEDWANQQVGYTESPAYVRIETPPGGAPRAPEDRSHTFEVMNLREEVSTPIGSFDCIVIKRTKDWEAVEDGVDASDADTKTFWFARGVGKVQERNDETGSTEVLTSYEIPEL